ncbi:hypothetical protein NL676_004781 [Syzygium grande]|nr:hypothetical protein NL676_004781 [Syzygium grande]
MVRDNIGPRRSEVWRELRGGCTARGPIVSFGTHFTARHKIYRRLYRNLARAFAPLLVAGEGAMALGKAIEVSPVRGKALAGSRGGPLRPHRSWARWPCYEGPRL